MSLREQGFRYCVRPDRKQAKWLHPAEMKSLPEYAGWIDVTDWPEGEFAKWLMEAQQAA